MADNLGQVDASSTIDIYFTTHAASGAAVAPLSAFEAGDVLLYKDGSATQRTSTSGWTMTSPFDSITGLHKLTIDLSDNTDAGFYAAGHRYAAVLSPDTETVDSLTIVKVLAIFSIGPVSANMTQILGTAVATPNTAGLLDVNAKQAGGTAWGSGAITAASIAADAITAAKIADAAIDAATFAAGAINAAAIAADAIGASELAADAATEIATAVWAAATRTLSALGFTLGASDLASGTITSAKFAAGAIDAAAIAADAIGASELAADAVTEIQSGLSTLTAAGVRTAVGLASANLDSQLAALQADTDDIQTRLPAALTANGNMKADTLRVSGTVQTAGDLAGLLATVAGYIDTEVAAIKAKTDNLPSDPADASDIAASFAALNNLTSGQVGDAVLDEVVEGTWTLRQMVRLFAAALVGKVSGAEGNAPVFRDIDDSKNRITATTDDDGNRSAVTLVAS